MEACDALGVVNNMTFGQTAMLKLGIASDRPIENMRAQLTQQGWAINAPIAASTGWGEPFDGHPCNTTGLERPDVTWWLFRLKLDNSMVDGEGKVVVSISDIDGLVKSASLDLFFQHAPTVFVAVNTTVAIPGQDLFTNVTVSDLDGLDRVVCSYSLYDQRGALLTQSARSAGIEGMFENQISWQYPVPQNLANSTVSTDITCIDELQQPFSTGFLTDVGPSDSCGNCSNDQTTTDVTSAESTTNWTVWVGLFIIALATLGVGAIIAKKRHSEADFNDWGSEGADENATMASLESLFDEETTTDALDDPPPTSEHPSFVPEGWTIDEYTRWLDGPAPEGWTTDQWTSYVDEHRAALAEMNEDTQG